MRRAVQLAALGKGIVAPNPMVGCVIWHPTEGLIGEGWHQKFGGAHAEVNAISNVQNQELLKESTLYVTLEPCSHFGKTPPCADLILSKGIPKVVVACTDPNPLVSGRGLEKLQKAGVNVEVGLLEKEAWELNRHFMVSQIRKRPFITLKWAQTADGFIAREDGSSKWISSAQSRMWVHKWRAEHQAILVGKNTLLSDNPELTVRDWIGPNPIRMVIDRNNSLPAGLKVLDGQHETWVFNSKIGLEKPGLKMVQLQNPENPLPEFLEYLWQAGIHSLFVEGGIIVLQQFIDQGFWDEAMIFTSNQNWGKGIKGPVLQNPEHVQTSPVGGDLVVRNLNPTSPIRKGFQSN